MIEFRKLQTPGNLRKLASEASNSDSRRALIMAADLVDRVDAIAADVAKIMETGTRRVHVWPKSAVMSEPSEICRLLDRLDSV
jgi:hypothetical protein